MVAMIAASAALTISGVPFMGPIGACRVGYVDGEYILNPKQDAAAAGDLDLVVAATGNAVMMVESQARELSEEVMLGAVIFAHDECKKVVNLIIDLAEKAAKDPWDIAVSDNTAIKDQLKKLIGKDIAAAYKLTDKSERSNALNAARDKAKAAFAEEDAQTQMVAIKSVKKVEADIVRGAILKDGTRIDGRKVDPGPPDRGDRRLPAAHPRFGAVHPRRNPGDLHHHARHQGRRADDRRARGSVLLQLHAAL